MSYTSLADLTDRYSLRTLVQLTDRAVPAAGVVDQGAVARALADTDAVIDGYVSGRYALPLAAVPPLLADLAQAIAIYKLHRAAPNEKVKDDYTDAMRTLQAIATGTVKLPIAGIEPASSGASGVVAIDRERPFTPENLTGFI